MWDDSPVGFQPWTRLSFCFITSVTSWLRGMEPHREIVPIIHTSKSEKKSSGWLEASLPTTQPAQYKEKSIFAYPTFAVISWRFNHFGLWLKPATMLRTCLKNTDLHSEQDIQLICGQDKGRIFWPWTSIGSYLTKNFSIPCVFFSLHAYLPFKSKSNEGAFEKTTQRVEKHFCYGFFNQFYR